MKITIAASHRFHLLDLARELASLGHEVRFYSYVPTKRAMKFGLKKETNPISTNGCRAETNLEFFGNFESSVKIICSTPISR